MACTLLSLMSANESAGNADLAARLKTQFQRYTAKYPPKSGIC
jgi:hypothetical protein